MDPADERYEAQHELSAAGVLSALAVLVQVLAYKEILIAIRSLGD